MIASQIPPIPAVPIADAQGKVVPEWWRWFQRVFTIAVEQQGEIDDTAALMELAVFDPPIAPGQTVIEALARTPPPDPPIAGEALRALAAIPPPDPADADQIAMRSMMLSIPT